MGTSFEDSFVGQVLMRASPVLTWRPTVVASLAERADETGATAPVTSDRSRSTIEISSLSRLSSRPTRRVVAWPVVRRVVRRSRAETAWSLATRFGVSALVASVLLALGVSAVATTVRSSAIAVPHPPSPVRAVALHSALRFADKIAPASASPSPPAPVPMLAATSAPASFSAAAAKSAAPASHPARLHPAHGHDRRAHR
jgi:hypothetical protein